ncbi:hypothetical protein BUQ74_18265 [Leptospira weilii serovar Heyan]|nr:hypothetical protein BUQ74_18265 [Leptospira weilii serovar Heyan]
MRDSYIFEFIKAKKLLHAPIDDGVSGNFWIYHPNKKNSLGEPMIYYLESDGKMICNPQPCNAGSVFLKILAQGYLDMQMAVKEILSGQKSQTFKHGGIVSIATGKNFSLIVVMGAKDRLRHWHWKVLVVIRISISKRLNPCVPSNCSRIWVFLYRI